MYIIDVSSLDNDMCKGFMLDMFGKRGFTFTVQETLTYYDGVELARDKRFTFLSKETAQMVYNELKATFNRDFDVYHDDENGCCYEIYLD